MIPNFIYAEDVEMALNMTGNTQQLLDKHQLILGMQDYERNSIAHLSSP